ncbi:MAG: hypothetical protein IK093_01080, partial [Ruminiclostridium sp.]|nr:hypothetical protein [Ruminiclostridium sp.]
YACGGTEGLAIYKNGGSVVQYCAECGSGTVVTAGDEPDETEQVYADEETFSGNDVSGEDAYASEETHPSAEESVNNADDLMSAMSAAAAEIKAEEIAETMEDLLADPATLSADTVEAVVGEEISVKDDNVDLSGFMVDDTVKEEPIELPETDIFEAAQREYEKQQRIREEETRNELDHLMFSGEDTETGNAEPPAATETAASYTDTVDENVFGSANTYNEGDDNLDGLMYDGNDAGAAPEEETSEGAEVENANIYGLMLGSEQDIEEGEEVVDVEVTELTAPGVGPGEELKVAVEEEEKFGIDENVEVTELYDDSNEGEDIEIEELNSGFNMPTDTKGGEIEAEETPLEEDGSVPMFNPNAAKVQATSGREPGDVRAFAYGSYENANVAEEPVRFDGRPRGYQGTDPRMGDEMGSVSRDYSRQQAAMTAPGAKKPRLSEQRVVSKGRVPSSRPDKPSRINKMAKSAPRPGSNAIVGTIAALLFGVIGCAIWCGLGYLLGLMSTFDAEVKSIILSVFGFLPMLFVFLGYRIGGDYFDTKGMVIAGVITVMMDFVGLFAVLVTGEMQRDNAELGFNIPIDKTIENVMYSLQNPASSGAMLRQLGITAAVMVISLVVGLVIEKKKNN